MSIPLRIKEIIRKFSYHYHYLLLLILTCFYMVIMYTDSLKLPLGHLTFLVLVSMALIMYQPSSQIRRVLVMIGVLGGLSAFYSPINDVPDEYVHYARSLFLSEGDLNLSNNPQDLEVSEDIKAIDQRAGKSLLKDKLGQVRHSDQQLSYLAVKMTNAYYSISYLPQALGLALGNALKLPVIWTYYLGRLVNLSAYLLLIYLALKRAGAYQQVIAVVAMNPMTVYLAASYNQDGFATGMILLVISLFLNLLESPKVSYRQLLTYYLACLILVVTKFPYLLLSLLPLFIREEGEKHERMEKFLNKFLLTIIVIGFGLIWYLLYNQIQPPKLADFLEKVNSSKQLQTIFSNLPLYGRLIFRKMFESLLNLNGMLIYGPLTYGTASSFTLYLAYLGLVYLNNLGKARVGAGLKLGLLLVILGVSGMITLALYLTWTPVGDLEILGVQSRYFIGLLPLIYLLLSSHKPAAQGLTNLVTDKKVINLGLVFLLTMLIATVLQYYR